MEYKGVRLSVLIPAYGYTEGVDRILSSFQHDPPDELEIIISDDSLDEQVNQLIADFSRQYLGELRYIRNRPGLGAVFNWNSLLEKASGDYILLLHHDEYPLTDKFVWKVLKMLSENPEVDVFVMECILISSTGSMARPHLPRIVTNLVVKYFPSYLFRRNAIGPASSLIIRRDLYPRFDERLRWLVDVETYFRLRQETASWRICSDLKIGSALGRKDSITASIRDELRELDARERLYLCQKYPAAKVWLAPGHHRIMNALEGVCWVAMRIITRVWYWFANSHQAIFVAISGLQRTSKK